MIPSMVSIEERIVLKDFLALNYEGLGKVVEIGAFAGSSAIAIMQGIADSRYKRKLHVYDAFRFPTNDLEQKYRELLPQCKGAGFREAFDFYTRVWGDSLVVIEGDAAEQKWLGGDIEFLHVDCSISREFHEAIAREFYPNLCLNAVIAHQDYGYGRAPFIAGIMQALGGWFELIGKVETTRYFRCVRRLRRAELIEALATPQKAAA